MLAGLKTLGPAVQYLPGELRVEAGQTLPLLATHNTVRLRFDLEAAEYLHLARADASFPPVQFAMLADRKRNEARNMLTRGYQGVNAAHRSAVLRLLPSSVLTDRSPRPRSISHSLGYSPLGLRPLLRDKVCQHCPRTPFRI